MSKKEILNLLIEIEGQLDDAVNTLPEYNSNVDTRVTLMELGVTCMF